MANRRAFLKQTAMPSAWGIVWALLAALVPARCSAELPAQAPETPVTTLRVVATADTALCPAAPVEAAGSATSLRVGQGGGYAEPEDGLVENNIFVDSSVYQYDASMNADSRGNVFQRNIVFFSRPDASLLRVTSREGIQKLDDNLYFLQGGGPLKIAGFEDGSFDKWRAAGFDQNSVVADPLFVDPANGDYRLKPESPAWKLGFKPIPFEKIGIIRND